MSLKFGLRFRLIVMFGLLVFTPLFAIGESPELKNDYRSGSIILKNSPGFGEGTDWDLQFYNTFTDITVAPDGSIFAASSRQHTIFKFDSKGTLIKSFGQEGQGPGDFNGPGDLSILDEKYLVVGEYALGLRISLFDLDGNFVKLLKTNHSVYSPTALRNGKIAYLGLAHREEDKQNPVQIQTVYIKDINTQEETEVHSFRTSARSIRLKSGGSIGFGNDTGGWTYLCQTIEGNLAVGISMESHITVYSPEGSKLSEFVLKGKPVPVTKSIIRNFKDIQLNDMRQDPQSQQGRRNENLKELEKASFDHLFNDFLPLYNEILVDEEGHFLVFRKDDCFADCPILLEVYTPQGEFVSVTEIKTGEYNLIVDRRRKHMCFTKNGLVALVQPKNNIPDFQLMLIKVEF
ncbi:MAG: 6-bladed beta-propeller [Candidatus Aminicenantes bacterium]|nr:6-bladed beta-propeller [Candidatus Aminicenantes bacterium]